MDHEQVMNHRTHTTRGLVVAVDDTGAAQTVDVQTHDGVVRGAVEVHQPFGFASVPTTEGAVVVLIANGGDHSDLIALPPAVPFCRFGNMQTGEVAIYAADGTRVHLRTGGIVEILAAAKVVITAPAVQVTASSGITLTGPVTIAGATTLTGDLSVNGSIHTTGNITADGHISGH